MKKLIQIIPFFIMAIFLFSACNSKHTYNSYTDYPVYYEDNLELKYTPEKSVFTLWSPAAESVRLNLYTSGEGGDPIHQYKMKPHKNGSWIVTVNGDLKNQFYTFQISMDGKKWLDETPGIWAKAVGINGQRAAVINMAETDPEGWQQDNCIRPENPTDIIIYEMHHRDFSIAENSGINQKGKFLALTETGNKTPQGLSSGIDHLKELGITHVHILPSYDFCSIDEAHLEENKYNWGYDPKNYNTPEGSFTTNPYDPVTRIREFKEMVQSLHRNGIGVIMDVVYNHTGGSLPQSNFELTAPGYFYRQNADGSYSDASACGNETASERAMMRHYMIESVKYWVNEYHVDGFRFDLMGIHDIETMNELKSALAGIDPRIFVYGEGWTAADSPLPLEERAIKIHAPRMKDIAVFSDDIRDALKGSVHDAKKAGFAAGAVKGYEETVKFGIVGATQHPQVDYTKVIYADIPYATSPAQVINYVSCHDDLCLVDKLKISAPEGVSSDELIRFNKLAQTVVFTSQGVPFMRAGEELYHNKKGVHNSYQSPDSINKIDWSNKAKYADIFNYYKGLVELRKTHPAFRIPTSQGIRQSLRFIENTQPGIVAYTLGENANGDIWKEIMVVLNGNRKSVKMNIPEGNWTVVCRNGKINIDGLGKLSGGNTTISPSSALIIWRN